jgi:dipeptidyl aminopeptidase/acylaminoacyl peptidase
VTGEAVRFLAGVGGDRHLFEVGESGDLIRQITTGERQVDSVSTSHDDLVMAYTVTDAVTPAEVFVNRGDGGLQRQVSSFNEEWLAELTLQPAERLAWTVADGTEIEGWVIKPVGYVAGRQYPMVLKIHGGPHGAYGNSFSRTFHTLSSAGLFVVYTNPRGSTGYGHAFTYATRDGWGEIDAEDYLAGVDTALEAYADIDPARVGVSGGSYGGFMTNWLTATTNRFAAAVTSRSIVNWESWYGSTDVQGLTEFEFSGTPWEQRELYRRLSPISYVEQVTAPTLIIHGENDYRTPVGEGEQWFTALKRREVPTELVRYPRSSHGLSRTGEPWLLVDRLERIRSWLAHWLVQPPGR